MSFEEAVRLTEVMLGFAYLLQSLEHLSQKRRGLLLHAARSAGALLLMLGVFPAAMCAVLLVLGIGLLMHYDGPYNGGADRMGLLVLTCLTVAHYAPTPLLQEAAFGYLAVQLVLSYAMSGVVKVVNSDWRTGRALRDVFHFSAYPVSDGVRELAHRPALLFAAAWAVMVFELLFPLAFMSQAMLAVALTIAALFHLANAVLFGLNRFFWVWLAAYPSILWLQHRLALDTVLGPVGS